jgi:hypothetical protein
LKIREKIKDSMAENTAFAKVELFIISSEKPHIGEMSNLKDHMKEKLSSNLFSAVMLSLPILTEDVMEKKLLANSGPCLKKCKYTVIASCLSSDTISDNNSSTNILAPFLAAVKLKLCIGEYIENLPLIFSSTRSSTVTSEKLYCKPKLNCSSFPQRSHILGKCPICKII